MANNNENNTFNNFNKTTKKQSVTTHSIDKTRIVMGVVILMLITSPILANVMIPPVQADPGDLLFTINNPTPEVFDYFGYSIYSLPNGNILVGAYGDNTGAASTGSAYVFDGPCTISDSTINFGSTIGTVQILPTCGGIPVI